VASGDDSWRSLVVMGGGGGCSKVWVKVLEKERESE